MRKPKFKVGDKVKVLRASTKAEHDLWMDSWEIDMSECIGKEFIILKVLNIEDTYISYKYTLSGAGCYSFPEFVLQNKIQVGEQLLLFEL